MIINETKHKNISVNPYFYLSKLCNQEYYADKYLFLINKQVVGYDDLENVVDIKSLIPSTDRVFIDDEDCYRYVFDIIKNKKINISTKRVVNYNDFYSTENFIRHDADIQEYYKLININVRLIKLKDFLQNLNQPYNIINAQGFVLVPFYFLIKK